MTPSPTTPKQKQKEKTSRIRQVGERAGKGDETVSCVRRVRKSKTKQ